MRKKISFLIFDILLNNAELWKALSPRFREVLLEFLRHHNLRLMSLEQSETQLMSIVNTMKLQMLKHNYCL